MKNSEMRKNKTLSMKTLKIIIQRQQVLRKFIDKSGFGVCSGLDYINVHLTTPSFDRVAQMFHIEPIVREVKDSNYPIRKHIYIDGMEVCCITKENTKVFSEFMIETFYKEYIVNCFECDQDKNKALDIFKDKHKYKPFRYLKSYKDLERYFRKKKIKTYETVLSNYQDYRVNWEELDEDDRGKKYEDYYFPITFKQYYKENM